MAGVEGGMGVCVGGGEGRGEGLVVVMGERLVMGVAVMYR